MWERDPAEVFVKSGDTLTMRFLPGTWDVSDFMDEIILYSIRANHHLCSIYILRMSLHLLGGSLPISKAVHFLTTIQRTLANTWFGHRIR
jgi:hypothetical protein